MVRFPPMERRKDNAGDRNIQTDTHPVRNMRINAVVFLQVFF